MKKVLIETLKKDYCGVYFGRIWYMRLERLSFDRGLKGQFKELSKREKEQRSLLNLKSIISFILKVAAPPNTP
jgi:hypothetical protein